MSAPAPVRNTAVIGVRGWGSDIDALGADREARALARRLLEIDQMQTLPA